MFPSGVGLLEAYGGYFLLLIPLALVAWIWCGRERQLEEEENSRKAGAAPSSAPPSPVFVLEEPPVSAPSLATFKKRLLIVDDSAVVRAKLRKLFEARYEVVLAGDGEEAWGMIEESAPFAAVITDLEMPKMDGFELIAAIQRGMDTEDLPIIAITGSEELQARVLACQGLFGIFQKPWVDRELVKRVDAVSTLRAAASR